MPTTAPTGDALQRIVTALTELEQSFENHADWSDRDRRKGLNYMANFVLRTRYIASQLDNIRDGKPVSEPEQIPPNPGPSTGAEAAAKSYTDVLTRSLTADQIIKQPFMLQMMGLPATDFGEDIRTKSKAVVDVVKADGKLSS